MFAKFLALLPLVAPLAVVAAVSPSHEAARANAFHIFNAIHSAMRQWGSSLNHNSMSVLRGTIPGGTLFSHGTTKGTSPPEGLEWLAFEIEHAETFAQDVYIPGRNQPPHAPPAPPSSQQKALGGRLGDDKPYYIQGFLHTYQASRDLNVLYIDGSSAAKGNLGTVDLSDFVIRGLDPKDYPNWLVLGDPSRAVDLCRFAKEFGADGIVRMEMGFEVIFCDFGNGLELISAVRQPLLRERSINNFMSLYAWARASAARYDNIGGRRIRLDFSRMASAWFYPLNFSNPDPERPDLPRLIGISSEDRGAIQGHINRTAMDKPAPGVDWQESVVDMVVQRFSDKIATLIRDDCGAEEFISQVVVETNFFIPAPVQRDDASALTDGDGLGSEAIERCAAYHLRPATFRRKEWTEEDDLIHTAVSTVTRAICDAFFEVRNLIVMTNSLLAVHPRLASKVSDEAVRRPVADGKAILKGLADKLQWTTWRKCKGCSVDEVCFVPMFPFGTTDDYFSPRCLGWAELATAEDGGFERDGYWWSNA